MKFSPSPHHSAESASSFLSSASTHSSHDHNVTGDNRIWLIVAPPQKWFLYHCVVWHQPEQSRQGAYEGTTQATIRSSVVHVYMIDISCTDCQPWHQMENYFIMSHFPFLILSLLLPVILFRSVFQDTCSFQTGTNQYVRGASFLLDINSFFIAYNKVYLQWTCILSSGNQVMQSTQSIK